MPSSISFSPNLMDSCLEQISDREESSLILFFIGDDPLHIYQGRLNVSWALWQKKFNTKLLFFFRKSDRYMFFFKISEVFFKINLWK